MTWFERCGYLRRYDPERRAREGQGYKKGFEVRFVLESKAALPVLRRLLTAAELRPGKPFRKHRRIVQPVYGAKTVEWFESRLPKGREGAKRGFGAAGQRLIRRRPAARERPIA